MKYFSRIQDLLAAEDVICERHHGVITTQAGQLAGIHLRPFPKLVSLPEIWPVRWKYHPRGQLDTCTLFYNQPRRCPTFLALRYIASTSGTHYRTFRAALSVLDAIAAIKKSDAILCDVGNFRISDRLLERLGWESHKPQRWHRNYIKRFYGSYPDVPARLLSVR